MSVKFNFDSRSVPRIKCKTTIQPSDSVVPNYILQKCKNIRRAILAMLSTCNRCFPHDNLSVDERIELDRLRNDFSVKVTPADKSSTWIIVPRNQYESEAYRQLCNEEFYSVIHTDNTTSVAKRLDNLLSYLYKRNFISHRELGALAPSIDCNSRTFYMLPKAHKETWFFDEMPPGRPIISDCKSITRACASFVEFFLAPIVKASDSYIRDSMHLISILNDVNVNKDTILFSMDITSLYTNIPVEEGIEAVARAFLKFPDPKRPDLSLLTLLRLILKNNTFVFNGDLFQQIHGVAMGCAFGASFANIFLMEWEQHIFMLNKQPVVWKRYIDDIFGTWDFSQSDLRNFYESVNCFHPCIKVTLHHDFEKLRFLDLELYKCHNFLLSRIGFKSLDRHCLLSSNSYHPNHVFKSIVYGHVYRWASHSSTYQDFQDTKKTVQKVWRDQGYSRSAIRSAVRTIFSLTKQTPTSWNTGFLPCNCNICTYSLSCNYVVNIFNTPFPIVHKIQCTDFNIIYVIICKNCKVTYVGQTSRCLRKRISEHIANIKACHDTSVAKHFNSLCNLSHFSYFGVEHCPNPEKRLLKENIWIKRMCVLTPNGLNQEMNKCNKLRFIVPHSNCSKRVLRYCQKELSNVQVTGVFTNQSNLRTLLRTDV